jgi:hypothetical protein
MQENIEHKLGSLVSLVLQYKKELLVIGLFSLIVITIGVYMAKDTILAVLSNQQKFLGAVFAKQTTATSLPKEIKTSVAKNCSFETSEKPQHAPVIMNEIAWMGNSDSSNNEWIELKNISQQEAGINNWSLINKSGKIKIVFTTSKEIPPGDFYLLERGGVDFLSDIRADIFFTGVLKNTGDSFRLFDSDCNLIDEVSGTTWAAGENKTKKTMERNSATLAWYTSNIVGGTPNQENTLAKILPQKLSNSVAKILPPKSSAQQISPKPGAIEKILISEIMVGSSDNTKNGFVELYNPNSTSVDLTGWMIKKKSSTKSESVFISSLRLKGKIIKAGKYFLAVNEKEYTGNVAPDIFWPGSYILSSSNNGISIYDNAGRKVDEVFWKSIKEGQSYQREDWSSNMFNTQEHPSPQNSKL